MQIGSALQTQAMYSFGASAAARISGGIQHGGRVPPPAETSISISSAAQAMLGTEQQAGAAGDSALPDGLKRMLEQMVDDPAYGAAMAEGYAENIHTACMTLPEFMRAEGTLGAGRQQLEAAWRDIASAGKTPAQGYAELLKYELSMSDRYWEAMDPGHTTPDVRELAEAKLAYLEARIAGKV